MAKESDFSRAYLVFNGVTPVVDFFKSYNGHGFEDKQGHQYHALVEYAPFQKFVSTEKKRKVDLRVNTIDQGA